MGTNYNLISTDKSWVVRHFGEKYSDEWMLVDVPYFGYSVHLGKRSDGWKPLFQTHSRADRSVNDMIAFLQREQGKYRIFDEYQRELDIDSLVAELVKWGEHQKCKRLTYVEGMLLEDPSGELKTPVDHIEYNKLDTRKTSRRVHYWRDRDGYIFRDGYFC